MTPDDIARLMNEGVGFEIEKYYTDKFFIEDPPDGSFVNNLIDRVKTRNLNTMYLEGESFEQFGHIAETPPSAAPGLDDTDEFHQETIGLAGVLVVYQGTASEEELIAAMIEKFKGELGEDWMDALTWH